MQSSVCSCPLFVLADDLLCDLVPDCRVLLMSQTCRRVRETLQRGKCGVEVVLKRQIGSNVRTTMLVPKGINTLQKHFKIRRFEYYGLIRSVSLKFIEFEEVTFMHLSTLRMHCCQLKEMHLIYLMHMLTYSKNMRTFEFTQQGIKCRQAQWLAECIRCFPKLETLNLNLNYFVFDSLAVVLDAVQTSTLSRLDLSTNSCEDNIKTMKLCRVIHKNCITLKTLNLSFMRLRNNAFDLLVNAISTCRFLESLDLSQNHLHYGSLMDVLNATAGCHLKSFNWSGNRLGSAGTFVLANHINHNALWKTTMRELKLSMCDVYNGLQSLEDALITCTGLHTLDVASNALYASEVASILTNMSVKRLNISNNYISDYGMQLILQRSMNSTTLRDLNVIGNHMTMQTLQKFRLLLKRNQMTVELPRTPCLCDVCKSIGT